MSGKSNYLAELVLNLIYKGTTNAALAATAGSATGIDFALHTADPGDSGPQTTNEVTVAQDATYARISVTRGAGFGTASSTGGTAKTNPAAAVTFPTTSAVGTGCVATHFSTGVGGNILHSGAISPAIVIPATTAGVIPQLSVATEISES